MIDLDQYIQDAMAAASTGWAETRALHVVSELVRGLSLRTDYEPPDEEWIHFWDDGAVYGMLSVRLPLALVSPKAASAVSKVDDSVVTVTIEDFWAEDLRASPSLLRSTVLPLGWDDGFDTEHFCANDLFVVSV